MTDRRSLQADAARASRAFQFVPGHVGGRVASAQPVKRRSTIGGIAKAPGGAPTAVVSHLAEATSPSSNLVTLPAPPTGVTSAVALVLSGSGSMTLPAGWGSIATGSHETIGRYHLATTTDPTDRTFTLGSVSAWAYAVAYFTGGRDGAWSAIVGPTVSGTSIAYFTNVPAPSADAPWVQIVGITGIWTEGSVPANVETSPNGAAAGAAICPGGSLSGAAFATAMNSYALTSSDAWDYENLGTYGPPHSISFAAVWSPT